MPDRSQFIGRLASTTQILFAVLIGSVASFAFEPGIVPRGAILMAIFAVPGVIGLIGVRAHRPALLVAAGLTSGVGSLVAFSGVTLVFLIPCLLFLVGAARLAAGTTGSSRGGVVGAVGQLVIAAAIVPLLVGAGASALLVTDTGCWALYPSAIGIHVEMRPYSNGEMEVPPGATSMGCSSGLISLRGIGLGVLLDGAALGLACLAARRRDRPAV
ncbi:MAG TPA: hypothetical protein VE011_09175 [Candidatus Dormibacteraeota bacterium]|nr:hypothetical protein [Candidatus Dormibacteraeota bacterium]